MGQRDDRILWSMQWVALVVVLVLLPALVILWGMPGETADLWSWTIKPDLTPIFMGAGYGAGAYFFARVSWGRQWHAGSVGALWWVNQRTDPGKPQPGEIIVPRWIRVAARLAAGGALAVAAVVLIEPSVAINNWGWDLTPLTARVLACFTAQVGVGFMMLSRDKRWSSWRLLGQTFLIAVTLLLVGAARAWDAFDSDNWMTYAYMIGLGMGAVSLAALYVAMERSGSARA